jgi:hypothetical protein
MKNKIVSLFLIISSSLLLAGCGSKTTVTPATPTPAPKIVEMPIADRPLISLIPRDDGHLLTLKISKIPADISSIEYELIYTAKDESSEIEKGLGDTIKDISDSLERKLLLGTESCTNGCKYKYDEGVSGGTLSLKFINKNGQVSKFESPFSLKSSANLNRDKVFKLTTDTFEIPITSKIAGNNFFILIKKYSGGYSVFSNNSSSPITGDYPRP